MGIANLWSFHCAWHAPTRGTDLPQSIFLLIFLAALAAYALVAVHGRPLADALQSGWVNLAPFGKLVQIYHGYRMFLECTGKYPPSNLRSSWQPSSGTR